LSLAGAIFHRFIRNSLSLKHRPPERPATAPAAASDADTTLLQGNATELAQQDGRSEARAEDRTEAIREQTRPAADAAQEVPAGDEALVTWNASPDQSGHLTAESVVDDEADDSTELAEEGEGEAEQDLRRAANAETHPHAPPPLK
jgi:hypothetical protein